MFDPNDYLFFRNGIIEIGINPDEVNMIYSSLKQSNIKKEFITASSPKKSIEYNDFYIKKNIVTTAEFKKFISETSYVTDSEKDGWGWVWNDKWLKKKDVSWKNPFSNECDKIYLDQQDILPVIQISWNDSVAYTKWLSEKTGKSFRLPFEYEWEILGNYAGINSILDITSNNNEGIHSDSDFIKALKSGIHISKFQLGLVWEWTMDWYNGYNINIINKDFGNIYKILRGGSLLSENIQKTKEFRFRRCPTARSPYYSFRVVFDN